MEYLEEGIDELFYPILKISSITTMLSCTDTSMGEIMNVCNQLAKDNAYNKTMSTLQLIHTLSTKLSPKYGHYCYRNIMKLIRMMEDGKNDLDDLMRRI